MDGEYNSGKLLVETTVSWLKPLGIRGQEVVGLDWAWCGYVDSEGSLVARWITSRGEFESRSCSVGPDIWTWGLGHVGAWRVRVAWWECVKHFLACWVCRLK